MEYGNWGRNVRKGACTIYHTQVYAILIIYLHHLSYSYSGVYNINHINPHLSYALNRRNGNGAAVSLIVDAVRPDYKISSLPHTSTQSCNHDFCIIVFLCFVFFVYLYL